jgi:hypothetical protein
LRTLETRYSVPQSPDQVWSVLIDYPSYARWNSFMREASGEVGVGKKLNVTIHLSSGSKMSFSRSSSWSTTAASCAGGGI